MTCFWDDDFTGINGSPPDSTKWIETDVDNAMDIQSNRLNFYGAAVSNVYIAIADSTWYFASGTDFDMITIPGTGKIRKIARLLYLLFSVR